MADEQVLFPHPAEARVEPTLAAAERPVPTAAEERLSDDVFTREQGGIATALLGLQAGLAIMHHLAVETFQYDDEEEEVPPRRQPEPQPAV